MSTYSVFLFENGTERRLGKVPKTGSSDPSPGSTLPKIGVYKNFQNINGVLAYESWLGRKVDYVLEFQETKATDDHLAWPSYMSDYYNTTRMDGRRLMLGASLSSRSVVSPPGNYYDREYTWQQLADGVYDTVWASMAQRLVASGQGDCIVRGAHEFNETFFLHRVMEGEQAAFIAAWRRWHDTIRSNGFTGKIHWNPTAGDYSNIDPMTAYPGDAYLDIIDLDFYDRWYSRGATAAAPRTLAEQQEKWAIHYDNTQFRGLKQWRQIAVDHGKGMGFSEWGLGDYFNQDDGNHGGGDNAVYVNGMADFILDPAYPPGVPGGVVDHAFWEHTSSNGVQPKPGSIDPDEDRTIPVPNARAAFINRFGGA